MASQTPMSSSALTPTSTDSSLTILDRLQNFISENRRAIIIASAAAIIVGGVGIAYYSSSSTPPSRPSGKKKDKKSRGKKGSKKTTVNDADGPLMEKVEPEPEDPEEEGPGTSVFCQEICSTEFSKSVFAIGMTPEQLAQLTPTVIYPRLCL